MSKEDLKSKLSDLEYKVTQECQTEPPFNNKYWNNKEPGIYVDKVSGEPLFLSVDKFDSGTGWPSFSNTISKEEIIENEDNSFGMKRIEVKSKKSNSHLGHLFDDGPTPTGLRYCINSASLDFIPIEEMEERGYEKALKQFGVATLAGGCFWGVEEIIRKIPGVLKTVVGYTGGDFKNPTYEDVKGGETGHAEAIRIYFDLKKVSYDEILDYFFRLHDPTTLNRQENDIGTQYRSAIFYHDDRQKEIALKKIEEIDKADKWKNKIVTEVTKSGKFYKAEDYHQKYLEKNPGGYNCHYLRKE